MQSLFEGSMYTFVFLWTPALSARGETLPHGMIFSCFMVSSMAGSALAGILLSSNSRYTSFSAQYHPSSSQGEASYSLERSRSSLAWMSQSLCRRAWLSPLYQSAGTDILSSMLHCVPWPAMCSHWLFNRNLAFSYRGWLSETPLLGMQTTLTQVPGGCLSSQF